MINTQMLYKIHYSNFVSSQTISNSIIFQWNRTSFQMKEKVILIGFDLQYYWVHIDITVHTNSIERFRHLQLLLKNW